MGAKRLIIVDPAYSTRTGHNYSVNSLLVEQGKADGVPVLVFANATLSGEPATTPVFRTSTYGYRPSSDIDALRLAYLMAESFGQDLDRFVGPVLREQDTILLHTMNNALLHGFAHWLRSLRGVAPKRIVIGFNLPPNLRIYQPEIIRFNYRHYAHVFEQLQATGRDIRYFCDTKSGTQIYTELGARNVTRRGLPTASGAEYSFPAPTKTGGPLIFFAPGEIREEKGHPFLINALTAISESRPAWVGEMRLRFVHSLMPDNIRQFLEARPDLFEVVLEPVISNTRYWELLQQADIVVCAYDPKEYACKSSSILWEALALGKPVIVSQESTLAHELEELGIDAGVRIRYGDVASLAAAFEMAIRTKAQLTKKAEAASGWYRKWVSAHEFLAWIMSPLATD